MFPAPRALRLWLLVAMIASAVIGLGAAMLLFDHAQAPASARPMPQRREKKRARSRPRSSRRRPNRLAGLQKLLVSDEVTVERGARTSSGARDRWAGYRTTSRGSVPGGVVRLADYPSPGHAPPFDLTLITAGVLALVIAAAIIAATWSPGCPGARRARDNAAERVSNGDFTARMGASGPEELVKPGSAFDGMAARLEQADRDQRQFLADVAHDRHAGERGLRIARARRRAAEGEQERRSEDCHRHPDTPPARSAARSARAHPTRSRRGPAGKPRLAAAVGETLVASFQPAAR